MPLVVDSSLVGKRVFVCGTNYSDLNGQRGTCASFDVGSFLYTIELDPTEPYRLKHAYGFNPWPGTKITLEPSYIKATPVADANYSLLGHHVFMKEEHHIKLGYIPEQKQLHYGYTSSADAKIKPATRGLVVGTLLQSYLVKRLGSSGQHENIPVAVADAWDHLERVFDPSDRIYSMDSEDIDDIFKYFGVMPTSVFGKPFVFDEGKRKWTIKDIVDYAYFAKKDTEDNEEPSLFDHRLVRPSLLGAERALPFKGDLGQALASKDDVAVKTIAAWRFARHVNTICTPTISVEKSPDPSPLVQPPRPVVLLDRHSIWPEAVVVSKGSRELTLILSLAADFLCEGKFLKGLILTCRALARDIPLHVTSLNYQKQLFVVCGRRPYLNGCSAYGLCQLPIFTSQFRNIEDVSCICNCGLLHDSDIATVCASLKKISRVKLRIQSSLSDRSIESLASSELLSSIDISGQWSSKNKISSSSICHLIRSRAHHLVSFSLQKHCLPKDDKLGEILACLESHCPHLTALRITHFDDREDALLGLIRRCGPSLTKISFESTPIPEAELVEISTHLSNLQDLNLGGFQRMCGESILTSPGLQALLINSTKTLRTLNLHQNSSSIDLASASVVARCRSLIELDLSGYLCEFGELMGVVSDDIVTVIAQGCSNLVRINLHLTEVGDAGLVALSENCPFLEEVDLSGCVDGYGRDGYGAGWYIKPNCTDVGIIALASRCSKLRKLDLHLNGHLTDAALEALGRGCPDLAMIDLSGAPSVCFPQYTDGGIAALASGCKKLTKVTLHMCLALTDASLHALAENCPELSVLEIAGSHQHPCGFTPAAILDLVARSQRLRVLHVAEAEVGTAGAAALRASKLQWDGTTVRGPSKHEEYPCEVDDRGKLSLGYPKTQGRTHAS